MKTILITVLAAAAITFAQPGPYGREDNGFERPYNPNFDRRQIQQRHFGGGHFRSPEARNFMPYPGMRGEMDIRAYQHGRYGDFNPMRMQRPDFDGFRGNFAPRSGYRGFGQGQFPQGRYFQNRQRMQQWFGRPDRDDMRFDGTEAPRGFMSPNPRWQNHKGRQFDGDKERQNECDEKQCPPQMAQPRKDNHGTKAPNVNAKEQAPEKEGKIRRHSQEAPSETAELKMQLRDAIMNKDYEQAEKIIKDLKKIDK